MRLAEICFPAAPILFMACFLSPGLAQSPPVASVSAARKVANAFVTDLIANPSSDALAEYNQWINGVIQSCGKPKDSKAENPEHPLIGDSVLLDGRKQTILIFLYPAAKGHISVDIGPAHGSAGYQVAGLGCQKHR